MLLWHNPLNVPRIIALHRPAPPICPWPALTVWTCHDLTSSSLMDTNFLKKNTCPFEHLGQVTLQSTSKAVLLALIVGIRMRYLEKQIHKSLVMVTPYALPAASPELVAIISLTGVMFHRSIHERSNLTHTPCTFANLTQNTSASGT